MNINIKGKDIELRYGMRALMAYENISGKSDIPTTLADIIAFYYCIVVASSKDYSLTLDDFIDYIDEHPTVMDELGQWLSDTLNAQAALKKK